jgi:ADP-ribose pyrophosphatase YjhB (NUDIX family)
MSSVLCDLGVAARVFSSGKILLVQEAGGRYKGSWGLPKGYVSSEESPEDAALRELKEESGLDGEIVGLAGVRTALRGKEPCVFLCYDVNVNTTELIGATDEISGSAWFKLVELGNLPWVSETMQQLAFDGFNKRTVLKNHAGITPRTSSYAVYRSSRATTLLPEVKR